MSILLSVLILFVGVLPVIAQDAAPVQDGYHVRDFGAKGDGVTDDTAAIQAAIDAAHKAGGDVVHLGRGDYMVKGSLIVKEHVVLKGIFEAPTARSQYKGSTLLSTNDTGGIDGTPFITLLANGTLKGLTIHYSNQSAQQPKPYPWTVRGIGDNCSIVDVLITNPWAAVDFGTNPAGRHFIKGLYAQPLHIGIFVDKCFDVGRIENVHLWPFWDASEQMQKHLAANATGFIIGRTDWEYISNCFTIFYKVGFHFKAFKDGPGNAVLTQSGADIGPTAVLIDAVQGHSGVSFSNCQMMAGIEVKPTNTGPVKFDSCGFWGVQNVTEFHAKLEGKGQVSFSNCHFTGWDQKGKNVPAIIATNGGLSVVGCSFVDAGKNQIRLEKDVRAATIVANRFQGGQKIEKLSKNSIEIGLNAKE